MASLITLAKLKKYMGIPFEETEQDDVLNMYISAISAAVEDHCKRVFAAAAYDVTQDGDGSYEISNLEYPINTFTKLEIDGTLIDPAYYKVYVNEGRIKCQLPFTVGDQNIHLVYNAGYSTIPGQIELRTFQWISYEHEQNGSQGVQSKSKEGYSVSFSPDAVPNRIIEGLAPFCRPQIVKQSGNAFIHTV